MRLHTREGLTGKAARQKVAHSASAPQSRNRERCWEGGGGTCRLGGGSSAVPPLGLHHKLPQTRGSQTSAKAVGMPTATTFTEQHPGPEGIQVLLTHEQGVLTHLQGGDACQSLPPPPHCGFPAEIASCVVKTALPQPMH